MPAVLATALSTMLGSNVPIHPHSRGGEEQMRRRSWNVMLVLWLPLMCACLETEVSTTEEAASAEQALVEGAAEDFTCSIEDVPPLVSLVLVGEGDVDRDVAVEDSLNLQLENLSEDDVAVVVTVESASELGESVVTVHEGRVAAFEVDLVTLRAGGLGLPAGVLEHSGSLTIRAEARSDAGITYGVDPVRLAFHPTVPGWRIYDPEVRDRLYDGGALSEDARAARARFEARLPEGVRLANVVRVVTTAATDDPDYRPEPDGPPDGDGSEGGAP
jgi:hypothetical protein